MSSNYLCPTYSFMKAYKTKCHTNLSRYLQLVSTAATSRSPATYLENRHVSSCLWILYNQFASSGFSISIVCRLVQFVKTFECSSTEMLHPVVSQTILHYTLPAVPGTAVYVLDGWLDNLPCTFFFLILSFLFSSWDMNESVCVRGDAFVEVKVRW